jgi:hypothetical protein
MPGVPSDLRAFLAGTANMTPEQRDQALLVKYGLQARPSGAAIQYKEVIGPDGVTRLVAVDPRAVGAHVVGSGETYGTGVGAAHPGAPSAAPVPGAPPTTNVFASPTIGDAEAQKATATATAKLQADRQEKLPKAQAALTSLTDKTKQVEDAIQRARELVSNYSVGYGSLLDRLPMSDARALKAAIQPILANVGFDALQEMRVNSPTGGALGNVSDYEGKNLQATIAALDTGLEPKDFLAALDRIQAARNQALNRVRTAYGQDFQLADKGGLPGVPFTQGGPLMQPNAATPVAATPSAPTDQDAAAIAFAKANPNDPRSAAILKANGL